MTSNREQIVTFMLTELERGSESGNVRNLVAEKWPVAPRTYDRLWKIARERHSLAQQETQRQMADISTQNTLERLDEAIIDKLERMKIASRIAKDEKNFPGDRLKALDFLAKIDGDYAPVQKEISGKNGAPIQVTRIINFRTKITSQPLIDDQTGV